MKRTWHIICLWAVIIVVVLHVVTMMMSNPVSWNVSTVHLSLTVAIMDYNKRSQFANSSYLPAPETGLHWQQNKSHDSTHVELSSSRAIFYKDDYVHNVSLANTWLRDYLAKVTNISMIPYGVNKAQGGSSMSDVIPGPMTTGSGLMSEVRTKATACTNGTFLVIFVSSSVQHFRHRETIRHTWAASPPDGASVFFVVGRTQNETIQGHVTKETLRNGDVIQVNITDSYANLTLKTIEILKWTLSKCPKVNYLLKVDDDTLVNIHKLMQDLRDVTYRNFIMGDVIAGAQPMRDQNSKWYTSPSIYPNKMYPDYVSGSAYVISGNLVLKLYNACRKLTVFWIEDVYITGMCAKRAKATLVHNAKFKRDLLTRSWNVTKGLQKYITMHRVSPDLLESLWKT